MIPSTSMLWILYGGLLSRVLAVGEPTGRAVFITGGCARINSKGACQAKNLAIINKDSVWVNFASDGSLTVPIYAGFPVDGTKSWEHPTCQLNLNLPAGFEDGKLTFEITEDWMCLVHEHKAPIPNSCCNDKTAYDGPDILNPYFNPSAQRTGDTLLGLISEPGPASPLPISGNNADTSFDQILAPLLASGSNAPDTYEDAWRDTPEQFDYTEWN